jgi:undecaprenyl-diphosphatase
MRGNGRIVLEMAIMLAVAAAGLVALVSIPALVDADTNLFLFINHIYMPDPAIVFGYITILGSMGVGGVWVIGLFAFGRRDLALHVLIAVVIEVALVAVLKEVVARPRPYETLANVQYYLVQSGFSFPSAHAAGAFAVSIAIGVRERKYLPLLLVIALAVAFSRVYIGVHFPLDAIAGSIIGAIIGLQVGRLDLSKPLHAMHYASGRLFGIFSAKVADDLMR